MYSENIGMEEAILRNIDFSTNGRYLIFPLSTNNLLNTRTTLRNSYGEYLFKGTLIQI